MITPQTQASDPRLAERLLEMIGASWMSQAICVAAELGIADRLASGAHTVDALATVLNCSRDSLYRLLRALTSLGLCREAGSETFALEPLGVLLRQDAPAGVRSWAIWWGRHLWPVWTDLRGSVMYGRSARELATGKRGYAHIEADREAAAVFNQAMAELTRLAARAALRAYDFSAACYLVDVGGGYGELLKNVLEAYPDHRGVLFDLPAAVEGAKLRLAMEEVASRIEFVAGDFFNAVPPGGDVYLLKSILHNWSDERAVIILNACRRAMRSDSKLVMIERVAPSRMRPSSRARAVSRTDLNMLLGFGGRERTTADMSRLLEAAGLKLRKSLTLTADYTLIEATQCSRSTKCRASL